ncbi:MAG: hypothetical protein A2745_00535 [Candidatus Harrisonbacteria bacterium RIFCSPHIGHO2_01_FULL_44_13]|uniref:dUTP diphosphatase n=1 Tax=Candidatus Harrisonbacteria bacterium RIFCSPLOWO2_01_FULL_44_18 TaxID=1798407 RepID=A0A1G1ZN93_9BACT|nr:MAG: hypothetical protein A2745_00535 [Candidatus Harrisonbacteria bacterium RIFCSPHIGHO2_01_FULL_44_13]OGY65307.1 MAG: hypothetical protein A3A16_01865 [Candidatus Harrisonbacteria bacterium RIFCSPLOWO2_01_FULL_44_18]
MKVKIRRVDKSLPLPRYHTDGAAALDCCAREKNIVEPNQLAYIPLNVCVKPPKNHFVLLVARSSLPKKGLILANGVGIGDEDFSGNNDEYKAVVYNYTADKITVERGDRIAQMILLPFDKVEWEEVDDMDSKDRGGFGSTGK